MFSKFREQEIEISRCRERARANKKRLKNFRVSGDAEGLLIEQYLQDKEVERAMKNAARLLAVRKENSSTQNLREIQNHNEQLVAELSNIRIELDTSQQEKAQLEDANLNLQDEIIRLRAVLGECGNEIEPLILLRKGDFTPKTISEQFIALGYRASESSVRDWLKEWCSKNPGKEPTAVTTDNQLKQTITEFYNWCKNIKKKLRKK